MDLQELVSITENLTNDCQRVLCEALKEILFRQKGSAKIKPCEELERIVEIGLLTHTDGRYAVSETAKKKIRKLHTYLVRKFDIVLFFDPETGATKEIPKGAEFVSNLDFSTGKMKLGIKFPDDDVTALLNLFGVNKCDNWQ